MPSTTTTSMDAMVIPSPRRTRNSSRCSSRSHGCRSSTTTRSRGQTCRTQCRLTPQCLGTDCIGFGVIVTHHIIHSASTSSSGVVSSSEPYVPISIKEPSTTISTIAKPTPMMIIVGIGIIIFVVVRDYVYSNVVMAIVVLMDGSSTRRTGGIIEPSRSPLPLLLLQLMRLRLPRIWWLLRRRL